MENNTAHEALEFEEIQQTKTIDRGDTVQILSAEDIAKNEIKKFNIADAAIAQLKQDYSGLKISGIEDKDGYKKVKAAWQIVRGKRLQVEKVHKIIKQDYLIVSRAIDGEKNRLVSELEPLEGELKNEIDRVDGLLEAERTKVEREQQERLQTRVATLLQNGIQFNGSFYAIGETISVDVVTLKNLKEDEFSQLLQRVQAENANILAAKEEQARKEREARELFERQQKEQEERQRQLDFQHEEMARQQAEMKKQRADFRVQILTNSGFVKVQDRVFLFSLPDAGKIQLVQGQFEDLSGEDWDKTFLEIRADINRLRAIQAEQDQHKAEADRIAKAKVERWKDRAAALYQLGMHERKGEFYIITESFGDSNFYKASELFDLDEQEWERTLLQIEPLLTETRRQDAENKKKAAEKKEAERIAAMSDIQRIDIYLEQLANLVAPTINDDRLKAAWNLFEDARANAVTTLLKTLKLIQKK